MSKRRTRQYKAARMSNGQVIVIDLSSKTTLWFCSCVHETIHWLQRPNVGIPSTPYHHELINENTRIIL